MMDEPTTPTTEPAKRDTRKKDPAPRGVFRHRSGVWAARFTCGAGHIHQERVGPLKSDSVKVYHERRARALDEPGWCPAVERRRELERAQADEERQKARLTFRAYAAEYLEWSKRHKASWTTDAGRIARMVEAFGDTLLDALSARTIERWLDSLLATRQGSTRNRYRTLLHAMLNRAIRHDHLAVNPVKGVSRLRETDGRVRYLLDDEERAVLQALPADLRPLFLVSIHTGLRWTEQVKLRWQDVDVLTGLLTVPRSKNGHARRVPMNSVVRSVLMDLAASRLDPRDSSESVFRCRHKQADKFFPRAVELAQTALRLAGKDAGRLEGYVWHCNRHTFASRLVMAGVDPRTVQELGGWRSLAMVQRYSHLAPAHLQAAVERLVASHGGAAGHGAAGPASVRAAGAPSPAAELERNFDGAAPYGAGVS